MSNINLDLNKQAPWINRHCKYCGRSYPDTILNIEGVIHHHGEMKCLNVQDCNKYRRKTRK